MQLTFDTRAILTRLSSAGALFTALRLFSMPFNCPLGLRHMAALSAIPKSSRQIIEAVAVENHKIPERGPAPNSGTPRPSASGLINPEGAWAGETFCMFKNYKETDQGETVVAACSNSQNNGPLV